MMGKDEFFEKCSELSDDEYLQLTVTLESLRGPVYRVRYLTDCYYTADGKYLGCSDQRVERSEV